MSQLITCIEQATPAWLTEVLQQGGQLDQGIVTEVQVEATEATYTTIISRLTLTFSSDTPRNVPKQLFLKISKPDLDPTSFFALAGQKEVEFYTELTKSMSGPLPFVPCYDAHYCPKTSHSHLLLADISATHFQPDGLPLLKTEWEQYIDALSTLHALWWEHPQLGADIGHLPDEESWAYYQDLPAIEGVIEDFIAFAGERLSPKRRDLYRRILAALPNLRDRHGRRRLTEGQRLTLIHGDAHPGNVLVPIDPLKNKLRLIDWQTWDIRVGTDDVAYPMTLWWFPERRAALEIPLLKRYHRGLLAQGVKDYDWQDCWHDYRLSAIRAFLAPPYFWSNDIPIELCWRLMEISMLNFEALDCAALL